MLIYQTNMIQHSTCLATLSFSSSSVIVLTSFGSILESYDGPLGLFRCIQKHVAFTLGGNNEHAYSSALWTDQDTVRLQQQRLYLHSFYFNLRRFTGGRRECSILPSWVWLFLMYHRNRSCFLNGFHGVFQIPSERKHSSVCWEL